MRHASSPEAHLGKFTVESCSPAKALMPLPWLYWMRLMPATNSPANLSAAGPNPISSCTVPSFSLEATGKLAQTVYVQSLSKLQQQVASSLCQIQGRGSLTPSTEGTQCQQCTLQQGTS